MLPELFLEQNFLFKSLSYFYIYLLCIHSSKYFLKERELCGVHTVRKIKFSVQRFFMICDQICKNWAQKLVTLVSSFPTAQKMKFSVKDFLSKCDQIRMSWK